MIFSELKTCKIQIRAGRFSAEAKCKLPVHPLFVVFWIGIEADTIPATKYLGHFTMGPLSTLRQMSASEPVD